MPCPDCAGTKVELFSLREFMTQWFNILIEKIDNVEQQNNRINERLANIEAVSTQQPIASTKTHLRPSPSSSSSGQSGLRFDPARLFGMGTQPINLQTEETERKPMPTLTFGPSFPGNQPIDIDVNEIEPLNVASGLDDDSLAELDMSKLSSGGIGIVEEDMNGDLEEEQEQPTTSAETSAAAAAVRSALTNAAIGRSELGRFTCRLCNSTFTQLSNLRRHVRVIHQGASKHECRYCGKKFAWKGAWRRHEQFVHELRSNTAYKPNLPSQVPKAIHFKPFE